MTEPRGDRRVLNVLPGGGYAYVLLDDGVRVEVRYLRRDFRQLHGELDVVCNWAGARRHGNTEKIYSADVNLSRQSDRNAVAKHCQERARTASDAFDFHGLIDSACVEFIAAERTGDDVIVLDDAPERDVRDFDILGLKVPADAVSMFIAHGDSLKSLLLLFVLGTLAQGGRSVLYVDWEWSGDRHLGRKRRLFGLERLPGLHYLRCRAPLTIEGDRIRRYCDEHHIAFIGGDSVGLACDGKLSDDDTAIRFHRAAGNLPPSLWAAHVPKASISPDVKTDPVGPFGSVFFSNLCRATWQVKKQPGATEDVVTVGLFPQKQNDGERRPATGFEFNFSPDQIRVGPVNVANVEGLADKLSIGIRMAHALKRGPLTIAMLANELGAKEDSIIKAAKRGKDAFQKVLGQDGIQRLALVERRHIA